jgi:hypothetical protein
MLPFHMDQGMLEDQESDLNQFRATHYTLSSSLSFSKSWFTAAANSSSTSTRQAVAAIPLLVMMVTRWDSSVPAAAVNSGV